MYLGMCVWVCVYVYILIRIIKCLCFVFNCGILNTKIREQSACLVSVSYWKEVLMVSCSCCMYVSGLYSGSPARPHWNYMRTSYNYELNHITLETL